MSADCDLCEAAVISTRYFEDETCWIADCEICLVPMVVWRVHDPSPPDEVKTLLARQSIAISSKSKLKFILNMRAILIAKPKKCNAMPILKTCLCPTISTT